MLARYTAVDYSKPKYASVDNIKVLSGSHHLLIVISKNVCDALWTSQGVQGVQGHALLFGVPSTLSREGACWMNGRRNEDSSLLCKDHYFQVAHLEFRGTSNQLSHFMLISSFKKWIAFYNMWKDLNKPQKFPEEACKMGIVMVAPRLSWLSWGPLPSASLFYTI